MQRKREFVASSSKTWLEDAFQNFRNREFSDYPANIRGASFAAAPHTDLRLVCTNIHNSKSQCWKLSSMWSDTIGIYIAFKRTMLYKWITYVPFSEKHFVSCTSEVFSKKSLLMFWNTQKKYTFIQLQDMIRQPFFKSILSFPS